jgi:hypothetical protein
MIDTCKAKDYLYGKSPRRPEMGLMRMLNQFLNTVKEVIAMKTKGTPAALKGKAARVSANKGEKLHRINDYEDFKVFFREKCSNAQGEYTTCSDIVSAYELWHFARHPSVQFPRYTNTMGKFIKKLSALTSYKALCFLPMSGGAGTDMVYLSLKLNTPCPTSISLLGELYKFKNKYLVETGIENDVIRLDDSYRKYRSWCKSRSMPFYDFVKFGKMLRKLFANKKIRVFRRSVNDIRLRYIEGIKFV